jgi:hypothetical protein
VAWCGKLNRRLISSCILAPVLLYPEKCISNKTSARIIIIMIAVSMTRILGKKKRMSVLKSFIVDAPNLPYITSCLTALRDAEVIHSLISKKELFSATKDIAGSHRILEAILALRPSEQEAKRYGPPNLVAPDPADFIRVDQHYTGPDGGIRHPLTKYIPRQIYPYVLALQDAYLQYLDNEYDEALPKRPGLIIVSAYRSPWYQAAMFVINVAQKASMRAEKR